MVARSFIYSTVLLSSIPKAARFLTEMFKILLRTLAKPVVALSSESVFCVHCIGGDMKLIKGCHL